MKLAAICQLPIELVNGNWQLAANFTDIVKKLLQRLKNEIERAVVKSCGKRAISVKNLCSSHVPHVWTHVLCVNFGTVQYCSTSIINRELDF